MKSHEVFDVSDKLRLSPCTSANQLKQIHGFILRTCPSSPHQIAQKLLFPKLISLCSTSSISQTNLSYARSFLTTHFDNSQLSLDLCNTIIRSISSLDAIAFFREMLFLGLVPDNYTIPFVLKACADSQALRECLQIHGYSIKTRLVLFNVYVRNTLMRVYAVCGFLEAVRKLFDGSPQRDLVSWTTLIQAFVKSGFCREAVSVFFKMCDAKLWPDERTLVIVISACSKLGDLNLSRMIHSYTRRYVDVKSDVFLCNALIDMYMKCGCSDIAYKLFDEMPVRNVVTWNSIIWGLTYQGKYKEALRLFRKMQNIGQKSDDVTLVAVLNSCANLGVLELGKWVHAYVDKNHIKADGFVGNALIDMYAKCGSIDKAFSVFQSMKQREVFSYTAMIVGFAMHGESELALEYFSEMSRMGIEPNMVTFLGILTACSHAGLVEKGKKYFRDMSNLYNLRPQIEHYGCMVDLLGRAGLINEAEEFIRSMEIEPDALIWGALLGACRIHGKVELAGSVMEKVVNMEQERSGAFVLMTNIYSSAERWRDALKLRKVMKEQSLRKIPGCSLIEVNGAVHEFRKGDKSHPKSKEIYVLLEEITSHMKNYRHFGCGILSSG